MIASYRVKGCIKCIFASSMDGITESCLKNSISLLLISGKTANKKFFPNAHVASVYGKALQNFGT